MKWKLKYVKLVLLINLYYCNVNLILEQLFSISHLQSWCQVCFSSLLFYWMPLHCSFLPFNNLVWQYTWLHHTWMLDAAPKFTVTQLESLSPCTSVQVKSFFNILTASQWTSVTSVTSAFRTIQKGEGKLLVFLKLRCAPCITCLSLIQSCFLLKAVCPK